MLVVTTETITGKDLEMLGLVKGGTIQLIALKTLVGGELLKYNEMMDNARATAVNRMVEEAQKLGADAIVCVRYSIFTVTQNAAEVAAYGTAVRFR